MLGSKISLRYCEKRSMLPKARPVTTAERMEYEMGLLTLATVGLGRGGWFIKGESVVGVCAEGF